MGKGHSKDIQYTAAIPDSEEIEYSAIFHHPDSEKIQYEPKILGSSSYYWLFQ